MEEYGIYRTPQEPTPVEDRGPKRNYYSTLRLGLYDTRSRSSETATTTENVTNFTPKGYCRLRSRLVLVYLNPSIVWTLTSLSLWKFRDDFDVDSSWIRPCRMSRSNPTARRRRNHVEFLKKNSRRRRGLKHA